LALALALGLPPEIPRRDEIVTIAFGIVGFSVIVQGLTIPPLLRRFNEIGHPPSKPDSSHHP
jgi:CPA1 family monovalent cation:H+ antiporter